MLFFHHLSLVNFLIFITYNTSLLTNTKTLNICSDGNNERYFIYLSKHSILSNFQYVNCSCVDESRKSSPRPCRTNFGLFFKKKEGECNDGSENYGFFSSVLKGIKRFVPDITKAKIEKSYEVPQTEGGYRYHIRLVGSNGSMFLLISCQHSYWRCPNHFCRSQ